MRELTSIAAEILECAEAWEPSARLVGNVRADELADLARAFMVIAALEQAKARAAIASGQTIPSWLCVCGHAAREDIGCALPTLCPGCGRRASWSRGPDVHRPRSITRPQSGREIPRAAIASAPGDVTARKVLRAAVEATALILCRRAVAAAPVSECDETCPHDCHAALMREAIAALAALKALDEGGPP